MVKCTCIWRLCEAEVNKINKLLHIIATRDMFSAIFTLDIDLVIYTA